MGKVGFLLVFRIFQLIQLMSLLFLKLGCQQNDRQLWQGLYNHFANFDYFLGLLEIFVMIVLMGEAVVLGVMAIAVAVAVPVLRGRVVVMSRVVVGLLGGVTLVLFVTLVDGGPVVVVVPFVPFLVLVLLVGVGTPQCEEGNRDAHHFL